MLELPLSKATKKTIRNRQYYIFPATSGHSNYRQRPSQVADPKALTRYKGKGSNKQQPCYPLPSARPMLC